MSVWEMEERTRSSIYATAQTVIWPWTDPGVAASSRSRKDGKGRRIKFSGVDLPWLLSGPNTIYLCSPIEDQKTIGSCTAHAAVGIVEYFQRRAFGTHLDGSRLFVYKMTRNLMGVTGDTGAWLRNEKEHFIENNRVS